MQGQRGKLAGLSTKTLPRGSALSAIVLTDSHRRLATVTQLCVAWQLTQTRGGCIFNHGKPVEILAKVQAPPVRHGK
eukprot:scaffold82623_cov66-Phaeocystis_antarctica.AAC.4